jgi:hypothetical protein
MSQVRTPRTAMAPTMAAATIQGLVPPGCAAGTVVEGTVVDGTVVDGTVVDVPDVVVVVRAGAGPDDAARKATTRSAEGASRRPAPTEGVGKWFAGAPTVA